jgi:hypothetical protein
MCELSVCQPVQVSTGGPDGLVVDATAVYWADDQGTVQKAPLGGGAAVPLGGLAGQDLIGIALRSGTLYFTNFGGNVYSMPTSGPTPTKLVTLATALSAIAVDANNLYFMTYGSSGMVMKVPIGGGTAAPIATWNVAMMSATPPFNIAVDATNVYWTDQGTSPTTGRVMKTPILGGPLTALASGQLLPQSIAVDGTNVYWVNMGTSPGFNDGSVMKVPISGAGMPTTLASGQKGLLGIAVDTKNVYFGGADVGGVPIAGGATTTYATGASAYGMAVDDVCVYWSSNQSAVMKVAK